MGKDNGYIKSGLVFQLDGIDKGTQDTDKWVDLVGGMVFTEANNTACHDTNCIHLTAEQRLVGDSMPDWPYTTHTIEAALAPKQGWQPIFMMKGGNVALFKNSDWQVGGGHAGAKKAAFSPNESKQFGFAYDNIVINGAVAEALAQAWAGWQCALPVINSGATNAQQYSKDLYIYSVRVYNRLLTPAEMIHNQQVDYERFNLWWLIDEVKWAKDFPYVQGKQLNNGMLVDAAGWVTTEPIAIDGIKKLNFGGPNIAKNAFYTSDMQYISSFTSKNDWEVPQNAAFMRMHSYGMFNNQATIKRIE